MIGTVSTNEACGCGVDLTDPNNPNLGTLQNPWRVRYCAKHAAAPDLLEALQAAFDLFDDQIHCRRPRRNQLDVAREMRAALEKAGAR